MDFSATLSDAVRIYLAVFFTFVAVFYTSRVAFLRLKERVEIVLPGQRYCATWWNHMVFRVFRVTIWAVCVLRAVDPAFDAYLGLWPAFQYPALILLGVSFLTAGFGLTLVSHFALGRHWRSGFDREGPRVLLDTGPYRFSRNPAFLGVIIAQVGFWLALPSWFSTLCLIVGALAVYRQTLSEEMHLDATIGGAYVEYKRQVPRWI